MRENELITLLDDVDTRDFKMYQRERVIVPTPEQDIDEIEIKGRDGSLTKIHNYKNILLPISFYYYEKGKSFKKAFRKFKASFMRAEKLIINDDNDHYYKIKSLEIEEAINDRFDIGEFIINFTLDPFQYEVDNEQITITSSTTITNDGYDCLPIIEVTSTGSGRIFINDNEITLRNINGKIVIDSEQKNAYRPGNPPLPANNRMEGDFPVIKNGDNRVRFNGDISKLEITLNKRWR